LERPFEPYEGDEPYVFVCYSHDDKGLVYPELTRLRDADFRIWYDEGISPGSEWSDALAQKIERCSIFLYLVTPRSVISEHCRREVNFALGKACRMLSVHLVPTQLPRGLELTLSNRQAILKHDNTPAAYYAKLSNAMREARNMPPDDTSSASGPVVARSAVSQSGYHFSARHWATAIALLLIMAGGSVWLARSPRTADSSYEPSLAVTPFSIVGNDVEAANYAASLTEELRTIVTGYRELHIISLSSPTPDDAAPRYAAGGNVERTPNELRIRASLTRMNDHETIWAATFARPVESANPHTAAKVIAQYVRLQLDNDRLCAQVRRTSRSLEAADAYCAALAEGRRWDQFGGVDSRTMLDAAQHALVLDPDIADAYWLVSYAHRGLAQQGMDWRQAARAAHDAINRGLALTPNDAQLLLELGNVQATFELDYRGAKASYRASLASEPLNLYTSLWNHLMLGRLALTEGNLTEAMAEFGLALRLNDASAGTYMFNAVAFQSAGENRKAIKAADEGLTLVQTGAAQLLLFIAKIMAHSDLGEVAQANKTLDEALESVGPQQRPLLIALLTRLGRADEARQLLAPFETLDDPPPAVMAYGYVGLNNDRAFEWIHKAIDRHNWGVINWLRFSRLFDELRSDPRWAGVMAHLEAEEAKGAKG
jgi:TolB-like protein/tetratricopeptide (TPR) repeat protein